MPDEPTKRVPEDEYRISLHEDWEATYWCAKLGCTEEKLLEAISYVGLSAARVEEYLKRR
jgi:hypothetical protein